MDKNGLMYFVDATMIRKVDQNGIISTLLGANDLTAVRPLSCDTSMDVSQVRRDAGKRQRCLCDRWRCRHLRMLSFCDDCWETSQADGVRVRFIQRLFIKK